MKKILILAGLAVMAISACKKEEEFPSQIFKVSYPEITLRGAKFITIPVGGAFVDSGATFQDTYTGETGTLTADTGTDAVPVDRNTPGLYTITYTAANKNTYSSTVARYVAVTNYPDLADISGDYERTENGNAATVARKSRALYSLTDIGGVAGGTNPAYFAIIDTATADFGVQYTETLGAFFEANVLHFHMRPGDTSIRFALFGVPGYGTAVRTFQKQ